jgi:gluconokinase
MKVPGLRSPYDKIGGIVYFGRMLDKIRLYAAGKLPPDYLENLGKGFDLRCCNFLRVTYEDLVTRVKLGATDEDVLTWCFEHGRKPSDEEIEIWNDFMRKRGWRDSSSARVTQRLKEAGASHRTDIQTMFDLLDLDEGRPPRDALGS